MTVMEGAPTYLDRSFYPAHKINQKNSYSMMNYFLARNFHINGHSTLPNMRSTENAIEFLKLACYI